MNRTQDVLLFVEGDDDVALANGIYADLLRDGHVAIVKGWTASGALSMAELSLLETPSQPVAVVVKCDTNPREYRAPFERILWRDAPQGGWKVALAIPDMTTWLLKDPAFAASWEKVRAPGEPATRRSLALHLKDYQASSGRMFDRDAVSSQDEEFAALNRFIEEHAALAARR